VIVVARRADPSLPPGGSSPRTILGRLFARGEIDEQEFLIARVYSLTNSDPLRRDLRSEAQRDHLIGEGGGQFHTAK
jgi:hypothetical protein